MKRTADIVTTEPTWADRQIKRKAAAHVARITALPTGSPKYEIAVDAACSIGASEARSAVRTSGLFEDAAGWSDESGAAALLKDMGRLGRVAARIAEAGAPAGNGPRPRRRLFGLIPLPDGAAKAQAAMVSGRTKLEAILRGLAESVDRMVMEDLALVRDAERKEEALGRLRHVDAVLSAIHQGLSAHAELARERDAGFLDGVRANALDAICARRADVALQIALSGQEAAAIAILRSGNQELIRGAARARTTTLAAIHAASEADAGKTALTTIWEGTAAVALGERRLRSAIEAGRGEDFLAIEDKGLTPTRETAEAFADLHRLASAMDDMHRATKSAATSNAARRACMMKDAQP